MGKWIDADALKKDIARLHVLNDEAEIRRAYEYNPHATSTDFEETLVSVFDAIDDAPSIDIVRCKECKHWHREINENGIEYVNFSKCTKGHYGNGLDFHCADGERREP